MLLGNIAVIPGSAPIIMHNLTTPAGVAITQADISAINYTIYTVGPGGQLEAVTDHSGVDVAIADAVFDTLQTGEPWTTDAIGYNFRHAVDVSTAAAFSGWNHRYLLLYLVTLTSGPPIPCAWIVRTPSLA